MNTSWNKRLIVVTLGMAFASLPAHALNLMQAYKFALNNDPQFRAAKAENQAGQEYQNIGMASLRPTVQYSYSTSKNKGELGSMQGFPARFMVTDQDYRSTSKGFSLRQPLFNLDSYARYEQGLAQIAYSAAIFQAKHSDLMVRVLMAFSEAKYAEDQLNYYVAQRNAYLEQKNQNAQLFKNGEGTRTDSLETQAKLDVAEASVLEAKDSLQNARLILSDIIGIEVTQLDNLKSGAISFNIGDLSFDEWREIALNNNAEIVASKQALEIADKEIAKSRAAHAPKVELVASSMQSLSDTVATRGQDSSIRSLGVQLVIPVYSGGYASAVSKQSIANREKAKADSDAVKNKVLQELRKQFNALKSGSTKIDALQNSVQSAMLLIEATKQSIKGGVRINLDLLNAHQQLASVQRDLAMARYSYLVSFLKLKIAAGTVSSDDLMVVASYFTPEIN
jgi:protease secretion system outer membrane protein